MANNSFSIRGSYSSNIATGLAKDRAEFSTLSKTATGSFGSLGTAVDGAKSKLSGVTGAIGHAGNQLKGLAGTVGLIGGAFALTGVAAGIGAATKAATTFEQEMTLVKTQAGGVNENIAALSQQVLDLAKTLPQSPEQLAQGLYHLESAGLRGAKAMSALKVAAQGAAVGNANMEDVTNALVTSLQSGIKGTSDYAQTMGTLNGIVGAGNMRMGDLTQALSSGVLSSGKAFGLTIQSVGAALASMADQSGNVVDSATKLRMAISMMGAPSTKAAKELKTIGLGQLDLANAMRSPGGIVSAVGLLRDHMMKAGMIGPNGQVSAKGTDLLSQAFGGSKSGTGILQLLGQYDLLVKKQDQVNSGAKGLGTAVATASQTAAWKMASFQSSLQVLAIDLGNVMLKPLTDLADAAGQFINKNEDQIVAGFKGAIGVVEEFGNILTHTVFPIIGKIADVIGAIPGPIKEAAVGMFALQKGSSWLFGSGPLQWGKSLLGGLVGGVAGKIPGVSSVAGATGMLGTRVFVTNWPLSLGGMTSAGPGDLAKGAEGVAGAAGIGAGTLAAGAAMTGVAVAAVGATYMLQKQGIDKQSDAIVTAAKDMSSSAKTSTADLARAYLAATAGQKQMNSNLFTQVGGLIFGANSKLDTTVKTLGDALTARGVKLDQATLQAIVGAIQGIPAGLKGIGYGGGAFASGGLGSIPSNATIAGSSGPSRQVAVGRSLAHQAGMVGMTQGATNIGWAGEAGNEAVAILRNPRPLGAGGVAGGTLQIDVRLAPDVAHSMSPGMVRELSQNLGPAIALWLQRNRLLPRTGTPQMG